MDIASRRIGSITPEFVKTLYKRCRTLARRTLHRVTKVSACKIRGVTIKIDVSSDLEEYRGKTYSSKELETLD
jgi:hypothetical protein